jgi:hypothetical protein
MCYEYEMWKYDQNNMAAPSAVFADWNFDEDEISTKTATKGFETS